MAKKKRGNGYYSLNFKYEGKRYCVYAKQQKDLPDKKAEKVRKLEEEKAWIESHGGTYDDPTLESYYDRFTERRRVKVKENTIRVQRFQFDLMAAVELNGRRFGGFKIREITRPDVLEVKRILQEEGQKPQNINQCLGHLSHIFKEAALDDLIDKNPARSIDKIPVKSESHEKTHRALNNDEIIAFFKAAKEMNSYYLNSFQLMIQTGIRFGEMAALYATDIDIKNGIIHIRRTITRSENGAFMVGNDTKTTAGLRDLCVNELALKAIRDQEEQNRMIFGFEPGLLFRNTEGGIVLPCSINNEIRKICKAAGVEPITSHAFRHTYTTIRMNSAPEEFKQISHDLGHSSVNITLDQYTHIMEERKKNTVAFQVKTV